MKCFEMGKKSFLGGTKKIEQGWAPCAPLLGKVNKTNKQDIALKSLVTLYDISKFLAHQLKVFSLLFYRFKHNFNLDFK